MRWGGGDATSEQDKVVADVRQGGVIFQFYLNLNTDVFIKHLECSKFGCVINGGIIWKYSIC